MTSPELVAEHRPRGRADDRRWPAATRRAVFALVDELGDRLRSERAAPAAGLRPRRSAARSRRARAPGAHRRLRDLRPGRVVAARRRAALGVGRAGDPRRHRPSRSATPCADVDPDLLLEGGGVRSRSPSQVADVDLDALAGREPRFDLFRRAVQASTTHRDQAVVEQYLVQQALGDPSPSHTVAAEFELNPACVRQVVGPGPAAGPGLEGGRRALPRSQPTTDGLRPRVRAMTLTDDEVSSRARRLAAALEPVIGQVYFSPECHQEYEALGFGASPAEFGGVAMPDGIAYFTSRGLGPRPGARRAGGVGLRGVQPGRRRALRRAGVDAHRRRRPSPTRACGGATAQLTRILGVSSPRASERATRAAGSRRAQPLAGRGSPALRRRA